MKTNFSRLGMALTILSAGALSCRSTNSGQPPGSGLASENSQAVVDSELFKSYTVMEMTIEAPFKEQFAGAGSREKPEFAAVVKYKSATGEARTVPVKMKLRGHRTTGCAYPKLKLKVAKAELPKAPEFVGANEIKIGSICSDVEGMDSYGQVTGQKGQFREAFIYRLGRLLGFPYPKGRPSRITYVDTTNGQSWTHNNLIFEDIDVYAKRMDAEQVKELVLEGGQPEYYSTDLLKHVDPYYLALAEFFKSSFVGDWDGSFEKDSGGPDGSPGSFRSHNFDMFQDKQEKVYVIPTDFDLADATNGHWAWSDPVGGFEFKKITPEWLDGFFKKSFERMKEKGVSAEDQEKILAQFRGKKDLLLQDLAAAPIDDEGRAIYQMRLEGFYRALDRL